MNSKIFPEVQKLTGMLFAILAMSATAVSNANAAQPVHVEIYSGFVSSGGGAPYSGLVGEFDTTAIDFATTTGYNWHPFGQAEFGADMTGFIQIPSNGLYTFTLNSDDGSLLFIDGNLVVDNGGAHGPLVVSDSANLKKGTHSFEVQFFEDFGGASGVDLNLPLGVTYGFAGTPGKANCHGKSVSQLARQFKGIKRAALNLDYPSVKALQDAIKSFCQG
ncbi:MAG: PA14 domain-containing protein [Gammaproteobacteria bacterium]